MPAIHPTAIIESGATLADDVTVGPFCHIGPHVTLGSGTTLHAHVTIEGHTTLGQDNEVWPGAVLGAAPQDLKYKNEPTELTIGDRNQLREHVTCHRGSTKDQGVTRIGSDNLLMASCHVAHDCQLGNHLHIANAIQLAGHVVIEDHAVIGGATAIHHFTTIGQCAFIGGYSRVVHDVPPFMKSEGNPARVRMHNDIGMARNGFSQDQIAAVRDAFKRLYRRNGRGSGGTPTTLAQNLDALADDYPDCSAVTALITHLRRSAQGVHGRYREAFRTNSKHQHPAQ